MIADAMLGALARWLPWVARSYEQLSACPGCGRVYWRGSHVERMAKRVERMGI